MNFETEMVDYWLSTYPENRTLDKIQQIKECNCLDKAKLREIIKNLFTTRTELTTTFNAKIKKAYDIKDVEIEFKADTIYISKEQLLKELGL